MKALRLHFALLALAAVLGGCASPPQQPLGLDAALWNEREAVIGIARVAPPAPDASMLGSQGLLDYAVNSGLSADMRRKVQSWDLTSFHQVPARIAEELGKRGYQVRVLEQPLQQIQLPEYKAGLGFARHDYRGLREQHRIDKLIVVSLDYAGTVRSYYSMIPLTDPAAHIGGLLQVVDLDDNRLLQYQPIALSRTAEGEWDEGPAYPNLTNAFNQILDQTEQQMIAPFRTPVLSAQQP